MTNIYDDAATIYVSTASLPNGMGALLAAAARTEPLDAFATDDIDAAICYVDGATYFDDAPTPCDLPTQTHLSVELHRRMAADRMAAKSIDTDRWADDGGPAR